MRYLQIFVEEKCEEKKSLQFDLVTRTGFWEDIKWYEHFADNPGVIDKVVRDFSLYLSRHLFQNTVYL